MAQCCVDGLHLVIIIMIKANNYAAVTLLDVLDAFPFYVMLIDEDHYILEANKAVYNYLGKKREEIIGEFCPLIIHGQNEPFPGCPLEESVEKNTAVERELFDDNTGCWSSSAIYPVQALTTKGKRVYLHMVTDITERVEAQQQLKASHEQLRRLSAHLESVREEEKKKIAQDLHDETSQVLASLYTYIEAAIQTLPKGTEKTEELLRKAQILSTTILDEIRKLIYELRPTILDKLGLIAAVNSLAESYLKVAELKFQLTCTGHKRRLSPPMDIVLFRAVQESFNNIVKYARARNVDMSVVYGKDMLTIKIKDDGIGFDVGEATSPRGKKFGLGLLGMKERVQSINGSLTLNSSPRKGTEVIIAVPVNKGGHRG